MAQDHYAYLTHVRRLFRIKYGVRSLIRANFTHYMKMNLWSINCKWHKKVYNIEARTPPAKVQTSQNGDNPNDNIDQSPLMG